MNHHCDKIQEQLAAECAATRPWSASLEDHLGGCEACAQLARNLVRNLRVLGELEPVTAPEGLLGRVVDSVTAEGRQERVRRAISSLTSQSAPAELDGRVVAACQPGSREDRAVRALQGASGPKPAPAELDRRIEDVFEEMREGGEIAQPAPPEELDERVARSLGDLPQAISRSMLGKLGRAEAPVELEERVAEHVRSKHAAPAFAGAQRLRSPAVAITMSLAAAALLWFGWFGNTSSTEAPGEFSFAVEYPSTLEALSPEVQRLGAEIIPNFRLISDTLRERGEVEVSVEENKDDEINRANLNSQGQAPGPGGSNTRRNFSTTNTTTGSSGRVALPPPSGSSAPGGNQSGASFGNRFGPPYLEGSAHAFETVSIRGDRRVHSRTFIEDLMVEVEYREEVTTDGAGQFTIQPLSVVTPPMDFLEEEAFLSSQANRESFFFRHRGFAIRDHDSFWRNYRVSHIASSQLVAGRSCERFSIERHDGTGERFTIAIDPATWLILFEERVSSSGELLSRIQFETLELDPDLSTVQLTGGASAWIEFDTAQPPASLKGPLLVPSAPPTSFEFQSAGYQESAGLSGKSWAQLVYSDGVEEVFFLFEEEADTIGNAANSSHSIINHEADTVRVFRFGHWSMIEGHVAGRFVVAVGRVHEQDLLLMLQSAVE